MYADDSTTAEETAGPDVITSRRAIQRSMTSAAILTLVGFALYLPGIGWGLPGTTSWSQDTIAGVRTLGAVRDWPGDWKGRYPPLHYFVLRAAYDPLLRYWHDTGVMSYDATSGQPRFTPPFNKRIGLLILIARLIAVGCAIGTGLGLWMTARLLTEDESASLLAALTFMTGAAFTYFAHLGNVDAPSMFWFAWSAYFYVRLIETRRPRDAVWLGLFGSLAIATKDAVAGVYPGMALVLLGIETHRIRRATLRRRPFVRDLADALFQWRWLLGVAVFVLPYLFINGVFHDPGAFVRRMKYWLDITPGTIHAQQHRYASQFALAGATLRYAAGAIGWPLLATMIASIGYAIVRHRRLALIVLVPSLSYYVIVIANIDFVYSRFLFPPLALLSLLVGLGFVHYLRNGRGPSSLRVLVLAAVWMPSIAYAVAMDAEMLHDTRYEVEDWFVETVPPGATVGACSKPQYLPRLADRGYTTYSFTMSRPSFDRPQPEYLVLSSYNYEDFDAGQQACMNDLIDGRLGYTVVATFRGRRLGTARHWLGLAGWFAPTPGKISPTIIVLKRDEE